MIPLYHYTGLAVSWLVCLILFSAGPVRAANTVTIGSGAGYPGDRITIPVSMTNTDAIAGIQLFLRDTPNVAVGKTITYTSRLSGLSSPSTHDTLSVYRIIIFGFGKSVTAGSGNLFTIAYDISPNAPSGTASLGIDQLVLSNPAAQTVASSGTGGTIIVLPNLSLVDHPAGQPSNQFDQIPDAWQTPLFRFGLHLPAHSGSIYRLAFGVSRNQLPANSLTDFKLHEDIGGDGTPDGAKVQATVSVTADSVIFSGMNMALSGAATRYFVLIGSVDLRRVGDRLAINLTKNGVGLQLSGATFGPVNGRSGGTVTESTHLATGFRGDLNFDLAINVADVVKLVRLILGIIPLDADIGLYDIDGNGTIDISDVVLLIQSILNGATP
jgi:hypothetical protein